MSANPHESGGLSVTLKQDGRDGMWMVFHGSPERVRTDMLTTFGFDETFWNDYTLHDLALEAQRAYRGMGNVSTILGGTPVKEDSPPWNEPKKEEDAADPLVGLIEGCESIADLQALYKRNVDTFKANAELTAAWKVKGKTLKEAGK